MSSKPGDILLVRGRHGALHRVLATLSGGSGVSHCAIVGGDGLVHSLSRSRSEILTFSMDAFRSKFHVVGVIRPPGRAQGIPRTDWGKYDILWNNCVMHVERALGDMGLPRPRSRARFPSDFRWTMCNSDYGATYRAVHHELVYRLRFAALVAVAVVVILAVVVLSCSSTVPKHV